MSLKAGRVARLTASDRLDGKETAFGRVSRSCQAHESRCDRETAGSDAYSAAISVGTAETSTSRAACQAS